MDLVDSVSTTLIIKSPSQKIDDLSVTCGMDWSVRKLKSHISEAYPSRPEVHQQKLIYFGKLLKDDSLLKDILKLFDPDQTTHTLHLVCTQDAVAPKQASPVSQQERAVNEMSSELRHRHNASSTTSSPATATTTTSTVSSSSDSTSATSTESQSRGDDAGFSPYPPPPEGVYAAVPPMMSGVAYDPQQLMWLQQMYAQQMSAYMQYLQQPGYHGNMAASFPQTVNNDMAAPQPEAAANEQAAAPAQRQNQGGGVVRMNAGGGAVFDDDEDEEGVHRDWLDWLYTLSRLVVLFTIVYFYSTPARFALVVIFFILFLLYQGGYLTVQRREVPRRQQREEAPNPAQQNQEQPDANSSGDDDTEDSDSTERESTERTPPAVHPINVFWTFFFNFFTSLVPQAPPGVNAN